MRPGRPFPLLFLTLCLALASCGKKGDPFLADGGAEGRITLLGGEWKGEHVDLTGRIHGVMKEGESIRAYYAAYPFDQPPCEGCPVEYQGFESFGREVVRNNDFSCTMTRIQPGSLYFFEARIIGRGGSPGPPSNTVQVEVPEAH
jgi:hypothetical protein